MTRKPRAFIASSTEALEFVEAVHANLHDCLECTVWNQGSFQLSESIIGGLIANAAQADFGIFLFMPDDITNIRDVHYHSVRDNVLFELGLFSGKLGTERTFIIHPKDPPLRFPSDLVGIVTATFDSRRQDKNWEAALGPACGRIRRRVKDLGCIPISTLAHSPGDGQYVAAICFQKRGKTPEFLLVRSTRGRRVFPKGRLREGESLDVAALRYAHAEGGIFGSVASDEHILFRYFKEEDCKENLVTALLIEATSSVKPRAPFRDPGWFSIEDAESELSVDRDYIHTEELRKILRWAYSRVQLRTSMQIQSGVVPCRSNKGRIEVLLITSKTRRRWILPKGNVRAGLSPQKSAVEEALQEAGVEGDLTGDSLGIFEYARLGIPYKVEMYPMEVKNTHENWPEKPFRERRRLNLDHAATVVEYEHLKQLFVEFAKHVESVK